jgi:hypothetical protein
VLSALEDLRRAASSATAAVAVATSGSVIGGGSRASDVKSFSTAAAPAIPTAVPWGTELHRPAASFGSSGGGSSSSGGSSSHILPDVEGSEESRMRKSVSFSGRAQVQQYDKDESLSSDVHLQQHKRLQHMTFAVPEPPPRKR